MSRTILLASLLIIASSVFAGDLRNTTRDGGGYEATLRNAGIPQSAGMVWPVNRSVTAPSLPKPDNTVRTASPKANKKDA